MPEKICVLLRGINVGGVRIKMDELKKAFAGMAYPDAVTVLATGNVVIPGADDEGTKQKIEEGLSRCFGYEAHVFLRSAAELTAAVRTAGTLEDAPDCHVYCLVCQDASVVTELASVFEGMEHRKYEAFLQLGRDALWRVPKGETLESAFGTKILGDKKYKSRLTSRNINTMEKILAIMLRA